MRKKTVEIVVILALVILEFCNAGWSETREGVMKVEINATEFEQIFPLGDKNDAFAQYFIGQSYVKPLIMEGVFIANVTFEPGCRNNWHIHRKSGQILLCTAGFGWYQEEGKPAQALKPGDVVNIPEGVKHWHGAVKDSWFSHLALSVPVEGVTTDWLEPVSDEEYLKLERQVERADKSKNTMKALGKSGYLLSRWRLRCLIGSIGPYRIGNRDACGY